jgi:hypothetical protein
MRVSIIVMALCAGLLATHSALADQSDIRKTDNAVAFGFGFTNIKYSETQGATGLGSETGLIPILELSAGVLADAAAREPFSNLYLHLDARAGLGDTRFNGTQCDQFNTCSAFQGTTHEQIYSGALQIGRAFGMTQQTLLIPYLEVGERYWHRGLTGPNSASESFSNGDVLGGIKLQGFMNPWVLSLSAAAGTTFNSSASMAGTDYTLGDTTMYRVDGEIALGISPRLDMTVKVGYENFGFNASAPNASGFRIPDSTTGQTSVLLGLAYHYF